MRIHPVWIGCLLLSQVATAGVSKTAPSKAEPANAAPAIEEPPIDDYEAAELKKRRIPVPPTQERAGYLTWKKKLPKTTRARLDRYCRQNGGFSRAACNGIGPLAIPSPPSLVSQKSQDRNEMGMTDHQVWQASLTPAQNRYYKEYCGIADEYHGMSELCGGTPLVLSFGDERVQYTASSTGPSDWPTSATPWLAMDRDGDGAITSAAELFGSSTLLESGRAKHGFEALAALDANRDGVLDAQDPAFASLVVWTDRDGDRQSAPSELAPLSASVVSLSLDYQRVPHCDARMNCEGERAPMQWRDASGATRTGTVVDVYLHYR